MPETLTAFHARVDGFTRCSLPEHGGLATRPSLRDKADAEGRLIPFFGCTMIYDLDDASKLALARRQAALYRRAGWCLSEPLDPASFHITLHDLTASPDEAAAAEASARMETAACALLDTLRREGIPPVQMSGTRVFSMVDTSLVMGFTPETEADCAALMGLYERFHAAAPLAWGLTPHVTLAYYRPGEYGKDAVDALRRALAETDQLPPLRLTLAPERLFFRRFSDMNRYY